MCDLLRSIKLSCTNSLGPRLGVHHCLCSEAHSLRAPRGITAVDGNVLDAHMLRILRDTLAAAFTFIPQNDGPKVGTNI